MNRKAVSGIMLTLLLIGMLAFAFNVQLVKADPKTIRVPTDYDTIQEAIDAADPGDTIYVYNGTYYERLTIVKSLTITGEDKSNTTIDGGGTGPVVDLMANNVTVSGFTVQNGGDEEWWWLGSGIYLWYVKLCNISDTLVSNSRYGVVSYKSTDNIISGNTISETETGVYFDHSYNNIIIGNTISNSTWGPGWGGGIYLWSSDNNTVADNTISNTTEAGIFAHYSCHNTIVGNVMSRNTEIEMEDSFGIYFGDNTYENTVLDNVISKSHRGIYTAQLSYNNTIIGNTISNLTIYACGIDIWGPNNRIVGNTITNMGYVGIQLNSISSDGEYGVPKACTNNVVRENVVSNSTFGINLILEAFSNTITGNNVSNNGLGILFGDSNNHTVTNNLVSNNDYGIILFSSNNTKIYHNNVIDNTQQVLLSESFNTAWDDDYPSGGNYWSDQYHGDCADHFSGPGQDIPGSDGIVDTPYYIEVDNQDNYPLMEPWIPLPRTIGELKTKIEELGLEGEIDNQGIVKSLIAKLKVTQKLIDKGKIDEAKSILEEDLIPQVQNLSEIHITPEAADILIKSAEYVLSHL